MTLPATLPTLELKIVGLDWSLLIDGEERASGQVPIHYEWLNQVVCGYLGFGRVFTPIRDDYLEQRYREDTLEMQAKLRKAKPTPKLRKETLNITLADLGL